MLKQVPTIKTPVAVPDLVKSFIKFWQKTYNVLPTKETVLTMVAQFCHESGTGSHVYNYNLCNIKARDKANATVEYMALKGVWEIVNGKRVEVPPTNPSSWFRSFPTLDAGAEFYCNFLRNSNRYKLSWKQVEAGNPAQFSHELRVAGFYTDFEEKYTKGVMAHYNKWMNDKAVQDVFDSMQPKPESKSPAKTIVNIFTKLFSKKK
jgi:flagellum-specific peptidoglycan hydrolase FlgJ